MKKIIIVAFLILGINNCLNAQSGKINVAIIPFTYSEGAASANNAQAVFERFSESITKTKRFIIVDRASSNAISAEKNLQKTEAFMNSTQLQQDALKSAKYIISGHLSYANATQSVYTDPKTGAQSISYEAKLSLTIKVLDIESGEVIKTETFQPEAGGLLDFNVFADKSTAQAAITSAIDKIQKKVDKFIGKEFPEAFSIVEIQEKDGKGSAKTILISGGSGSGLKKGDKMKVVETSKILVNGKELSRKKQIGELKITKIDDENFSVCEVKTGGVDISSKTEAMINLEIITLD
jgi:hypothetical protein